MAEQMSDERLARLEARLEQEHGPMAVNVYCSEVRALIADVRRLRGVSTLSPMDRHALRKLING